MDICEILGIYIPIIQAPMAGVQNWELALAVSEAGGLGSIPCGMLSVDQIVSELESFTARSTKPYNLNFFCHEMPGVDEPALSAWKETLATYYDEFDVSPPEGMSGLRLPFDDKVADALESFKPPVVSFHFGLPSPELLERVKSWGSVVLSTATMIEEGVWLQANGADVVIAQGVEAGGHRGMFLTDDADSQLPLAELISGLVAELSIPVIAAGGITSAADVKGILDQGAAAVQIGTSYLLCNEAKTSAQHRAAIKDECSVTALTNVFSGRLARGIKNRVMNDLDCVYSGVPEFPYASVALGPLRTAAEGVGRPDFTPLWSGTERSGCREVSAKELTRMLWPA